MAKTKGKVTMQPRKSVKQQCYTAKQDELIEMVWRKVQFKKSVETVHAEYERGRLKKKIVKKETCSYTRISETVVRRRKKDK